MFDHRCYMYIKPLSVPIDINEKCTFSNAKSAPAQHIRHTLSITRCCIVQSLIITFIQNLRLFQVYINFVSMTLCLILLFADLKYFVIMFMLLNGVLENEIKIHENDARSEREIGIAASE